MINPRCGEVWENRRVFQGAVGNATRFPWPRRLSAAVGSEPELRPPFVSKSLTRSVPDRKAAVAKAPSPVRSVGPTDAAISKRGQKRTKDGEPVQDFRDILRSLTSLTRMECRPKDPKLPSITRTNTAAPYHRKVFELLQVAPL